jgi:hypothetical protein
MMTIAECYQTVESVYQGEKITHFAWFGEPGILLEDLWHFGKRIS